MHFIDIILVVVFNGFYFEMSELDFSFYYVVNNLNRY